MKDSCLIPGNVLLDYSMKREKPFVISCFDQLKFLSFSVIRHYFVNTLKRGRGEVVGRKRTALVWRWREQNKLAIMEVV